jgi:hypothetical protein
MEEAVASPALITHKGKIPTRADQLDVEAECVTREQLLNRLRNRLRNRRCAACGNAEAASKCATCWDIGRRVNYCNHACQRTHWPTSSLQPPTGAHSQPLTVVHRRRSALTTHPLRQATGCTPQHRKQDRDSLAMQWMNLAWNFAVIVGPLLPEQPCTVACVHAWCAWCAWCAWYS